MKAARIHRFGPPDVIELDDLPQPAPDRDEVLVRVAAAGVGPWDALIREHKSVVEVSLPLTLGSDISGIVESVGSDVRHLKRETRYTALPILNSSAVMRSMLWPRRAWSHENRNR